MTSAIEIRESLPEDAEAVRVIYPDAFREEDLLPLVAELLAPGQPVLSLVAVIDGAAAGHAAFTHCAVPECGGKAALLGPLAVASARQRQGVGTALISEGLKRLEAAGVAQVLVLGDPAYYSRHGFAPERGVAPPYQLPEEWRDAWQSLALGGAPALAGTLDVPAVWRHPEYWGP